MKKLSKSIRGGMPYFRKVRRLAYREGKPKVYQIQVVRGNVIGKEDIIPYAAKAAHVPETDIALAMNAFFDAIDYFCANGHRVEVDGLGSFGTVTNSKVARSLEECNAYTITKRRLRLWPTGDLRTMGANITFEENINMTDQAIGLIIDGDDEVTNSVTNFSGKTAVFGNKYLDDGQWKTVAEGQMTSNMFKVPTDWTTPGVEGTAIYQMHNYVIEGGVVSVA